MAFIGGGANLGSAIGSILLNTGQSEQNIDRLTQSVDAFDKRTSRIGGGATELGLGLAGFGGAIAAGFVAAGDAAANFEQRMSAVAAVSGATGKEMDALTAKALQLGKDTQYSATEAASAIEELAKAGVSTDNIIKGAADAAVSLAAAGGIALPQAATIIANTMNQFSLSGDEVVRVADLFAAAASATAADVTGLGESLTYVGATAHSMGQSLDETVALLAALADQGLQGSAAGTGLNQMILSLVAPTTGANDALKALGITVFDNNGKFKGAEQFVKDFAAATKGMSDEQRIAYENQIFTTHGLNALNLLLNDTTDSQIKAGKGLDDYNKAVTKQGAAADQAAKRMDNFKGSLEQLRGTIETLDIKAGDVFLGTARKIVDGVNLVAGAMLSLPTPVTKAIVAIAGLAGASASLLGAYVLLEPKITSALNTFNAIKPAILGVLEPIALVIAALALIGIAYKENFGGFADFVNGVAGDIAGALGHVADIVGEAKHGLDELLHYRHGDASGVLNTVLGISAAFNNLGVGQQGAFQMALALDSIRIPIVKLENDFASINPVVTGFFDILGGDRSKRRMDEFKKAATYLFGRAVAKDFFQSTIRLSNAVDALFGSFKTATGIDLTKWISIPGIFTAATGAFKIAADFIDGKLLPAVGKVLVGAMDDATTAALFLIAHMDTVVAGFNGVVDVVKILAGLVSGNLASAFTIIGDLLTGNLSGAWETFKKDVRDTFAGVVQLGDITVQFGTWLFDIASGLYDTLKSKVYDAVSGGQTSGAATGAGFPVGGGNVSVSLGTVTLAVAKWAIGEIGDAAAGVWSAITDFVFGGGGGDPTGGATGANGRRQAGGGNRDIPIPSVGVRIERWLVSTADDIVQRIKDAALSGIDLARQGGVALGNVLASIGGWLVELAPDAGAIADAVSTKALELWGAVKDTAIGLGDVTVSIGGWVVHEGASLLIPVYAKVASLWGDITKTAQKLEGYAVDVASYVWDEASQGKLKDDLKTGVKTVLDALDVHVDGWSVTFGTPSDSQFHVDTAGIAKKLIDILTQPLTLDESTAGAAQDAGKGIGLAVFNAVIGGIRYIFSSDFFSSGGLFSGGDGNGPSGKRVGLDTVISGFVIGLLDGLSGGDTADKMVAKGDAWLKDVNDRFVKWFDGIPGRLWGAIKDSISGGDGRQGTSDQSLIDGILAVWNFDPGNVNEKIDAKLNAAWDSISGAISGWWSGIGDKIRGIFGGATSSNNSLLPPPPGTGAKSGNGIWQGLVDALTPDLSGVGLPNLPGWVVDPINDIPGLHTLLDGLGKAADLVQKGWDKIFGINDSQGGHKGAPMTPFGPAGFSSPFTPPPTSAPPTAAPTPVDTPVQANPTGTPVPQGLLHRAILDSLGLGATPVGAAATLPTLDVNQPINVITKTTTGTTDPFARNGPEKPPTVTATFLADDSDVAQKYTDVMTWAGVWASSTFTAAFLAVDGDVAQKYTDVFTWGTAWGLAAFSGAFNADNSDAAQKYTDAFRWGDAWDGTTFTAKFDVDTSGLINAANTADLVAAHIAAVMPHSPAKEGPLKKPITFDYIADNFGATAGRIKSLANDSAKHLSRTLNPRQTAHLMAQLQNGVAGPQVSVTNHNYALTGDDLQQLLQQSATGAAAAAYIRDSR